MAVSCICPLRHCPVFRYVAGKYEKLYVNGQLIETASLPANPVPLVFPGAQMGTWQFANNSFGRFGHLELTSLRWWSKEMDGKDLCPKGDEDGLLLMYDFSPKSCGNIVKDLSGNGHDGVRVTATWRASEATDSCGAVPPPTTPPCDQPNVVTFNGVRCPCLSGPLCLHAVCHHM